MVVSLLACNQEESIKVDWCQQAAAERLKGKLKGRPHITLPDSLIQNKEEQPLQASSW